MKAIVKKLTDETKYNFRNECVGLPFKVLKFEDKLFGGLYTLDTTELLGCVTAWKSEFLNLFQDIKLEGEFKDADSFQGIVKLDHDANFASCYIEGFDGQDSSIYLNKFQGKNVVMIIKEITI
jgi:hypothetical protein